MAAEIINLKQWRNKPVDVSPGCDSPIDDQTPYSDPPLEEYVKSAGYPSMDGRAEEAIKSIA